MNVFRATLLLLVLTVAGTVAEETNTVVTVDGVTYEGVRWGTVTPTTVSILHKTGAATIPLEKLPLELQKRFGFDPQRAAQYRANEAEHKRQLEAQKQKAATEIASRPGTLAYLDACNGFRDVKFGQTPDEITGLVLVEKHGGESVYQRPTDKLSIGLAHLAVIRYKFVDGKLASISGDFASYDDCVQGTQEMRNYYGEPSKKYESPAEVVAGTYSHGMIFYDWVGKRVNAHCDGTDKYFTFLIQNDEVWDARKSSPSPDL
jgi:hypothetical protein